MVCSTSKFSSYHSRRLYCINQHCRWNNIVPIDPFLQPLRWSLSGTSLIHSQNPKATSKKNTSTSETWLRSLGVRIVRTEDPLSGGFEKGTGELKTAEHTNRLEAHTWEGFYPKLVSACFSVFKLMMGQFFFSEFLFYTFWGNIQASLTNNKQTNKLVWFWIEASLWRFVGHLHWERSFLFTLKERFIITFLPVKIRYRKSLVFRRIAQKKHPQFLNR